MDKINFSLVEAQGASQQYDNQGAYNQLMEMMKRGDKLSVKFYTGKKKNASAWIESSHVSGFRYDLKNVSFNGIINYLLNGTVNDFDPNPMETDVLEDNQDFQIQIMKLFIENGWTLQYVPRFRERTQKITAFINLFKGNITFRIDRTNEIMDYLLEHEQAA